jgi:hypothetical protein
MNIAFISILAPDDLDGVDDLILRPDTPADDPRREEDAPNEPGALKLVEGGGQIVGFGYYSGQEDLTTRPRCAIV